MTLYNSPFTTDNLAGGAWTAVRGAVPNGGITGNWNADAGSTVVPLLPDSQPPPGELGVAVVAVEKQPETVMVAGIAYQQTTGIPNPGEYSYDLGLGVVSISLLSPILPGESVYVTYRQAVPYSEALKEVSVPGGTSLEFIDYISREEIGGDAWEWLKRLNCNGTLTLNRSKGGHPTISLELTSLTANAAAVRELLSDYVKIYYFFGIPFYQRPAREIRNPATDYVTFFVEYEGIHAPRSEYCPLDYFVYLASDETSTSGNYSSGGSSVLPDGRVISVDASPEEVRRISQLADETGLTAPPLVISTIDKNESDRVQVRTELENLAARAGGWVYYDGIEPEIRFPGSVAIHQFNLDDSFGIPFEIERGGVPGAPSVDGVLLSSPWHHRAWQPDRDGVPVNENDQSDPYSPEELADAEIEVRLVGKPDTEVSSPTKLVRGVGYDYRSNEEIDTFPQSARTPGGLAYSGNSAGGFNKSKYEQRRQAGIDLGQTNGVTWAWDVISLDTYTYIDPSPFDAPFSLDPVWIYLNPSYDEFWKKVKNWNIFVSTDPDGYVIRREEIGTDSFRPRQEGSPHEAADLIYEANKLDYEASQLELEGDFEGAAQKRKDADAKEKEAELYRLVEIPYKKITQYFYRNLSLDRDDITDPSPPDPCVPDERQQEPPRNPAARYVENELTETDTLRVIDNPVPGEPPIVIGIKERVEKLVYADRGGWYETTTVTAVNPDGTEAITSTETRNLDGTPPPASRIPKPRTGRDKPKEENPSNPVTTYFSTPNPIDWDKASRSPVSIPGLATLEDAQIALLELARNENLTSEQTKLNAIFRRNVKPGDGVNLEGMRWQVQNTNLVVQLYPGLLLCRSFEGSLGSYLLGLSLEDNSQSSCAV